ncbi:hypothetical protein M23134_02832 [Microscilla marina ATCC 23134]|uniref:Uncharacterized protein n=1 Tax=Microscilla marina ATCC 23134 TaxID=313606 RepID=A1ZPT0_MICM2|nr:hypothetical protein M23134_02832 [Microscilla marina ATCC 23134]
MALFGQVNIVNNITDFKKIIFKGDYFDIKALLIKINNNKLINVIDLEPFSQLSDE